MPKFAVYFNHGTFLKAETSYEVPTDAYEQFVFLKDLGFEGVQGGDADLAGKAGLAYASCGRVDRAEDALPFAQKQQERGFDMCTLHVGTGLESDAEIDEVVQAIVAASAETGVQLPIETHRATITQDIRRTVDMIERNPDVRINADFSHYYTGLEMPYGDFDAKLDFMQPIFDRVRFMHGRIGNPGCIQVDVGTGKPPYPMQTGDRDFVGDFREMWTRSMVGFLRTADEDEVLAFAPELLPSHIYYARSFPDAAGVMREETDRIQQAVVYAEIIRECWTEALQRIS